MTEESDGQAVVRENVQGGGEGETGPVGGASEGTQGADGATPEVRQEGMNLLDNLCQNITTAWSALFDTHKNDPATIDIVALGLQHTGQLIGALRTLALMVSQQPGPTGEYPDGKLNEDDEGELRLSVTHQNGNVILDFGKPTSWIALPFDQVPNLRDVLMHHAQAAGEEMVELDAMRDEENDGGP